MRFVLDASVAVSAARPSEPFHAQSRKRIERVLQHRDRIVIPILFGIEVSAALARADEKKSAIQHYVNAFVHGPHEVIAMPASALPDISEVAMSCKLRAADSVYVWVAREYDIPLCTLDDEIVKRASRFCSVIRP